MPYQYFGTLMRAVDGDTVDAALDLGFRMGATLRFRLLKVDAPEHREAGWAECKAFTQNWFGTYGKVVFTTIKTDDFGRWLAQVTTIDGAHDLSVELQALMDQHGWTSPAVRLTKPD